MNEQKIFLLEEFFDEVDTILSTLNDASRDIKGRWIWLQNDLRNMIYVVSTSDGK